MGIFVGIVLNALLKPAEVVAATSRPAPVVAAYHDRNVDAQSMLQDVNNRRAARGLAPLQLDPLLCDIARQHALDMASRDYFSHDSPDGASPFDRMDRAGYRYGYAGENLALDASVAAAANALWHSPEHRENILEPHYAKVGIAAVPAADGEIFVEDFSD